MAQRRMFSLQIVDSDAFLDMPQSSQLLYFHLSMRADDDGFVGNPKKILRMVGANDDDFKILLAKRFLLAFESGVVVIKHWKIHNYIAKDRYHESQYHDEKNLIKTKENGAYTECIQDVDKMDTQVRLGKDRLGKDRLGEQEHAAEAAPAQKSGFTKPTLDEVRDYCKERNNGVDPQKWFDYYSSNGWKVGRNSMKDWKAAVRTWERNRFDTGNKIDNIHINKSDDLLSKIKVHKTQ